MYSKYALQDIESAATNLHPSERSANIDSGQDHHHLPILLHEHRCSTH
jgi:hypothetical protein